MNARNVHATDNLSASALSTLLHHRTTAKYKITALAVFIFLPMIPLKAAVLTVTSLADNGPGSLRDTVAASSSDDIIRFTVTGVIGLNSAIIINHSLNVQGPGASLLAINANHADRAFIINGVTTNFISGLTITNGFVAGPPGTDGSNGQSGTDGGDAFGGAILNQGDSLTVSNCWFDHNEVQGGRGGDGGDNPFPQTLTPGNGGAGGKAEGGAIYSTSYRVALINCTFSYNRVVGGHGGDGGTNYNPATGVSGGRGGEGGAGQGGAINSTAATAVTGMTNSTFSGNRVGGGGGGKGGDNVNGPGGNGGNGGTSGGGAIATFNVSAFQSSTVVSNAVIGGNGGLGGNGTPPGTSGSTGSATGGGVVGYVVTCNNPIVNTILADNYSSGVDSNYFMAFNDGGHNFIGSDDFSFCSWGPTTQVGTVPVPIHPQLGPLVQNGGGRPTHATTLTSPVTDAGMNPGLSTDERGAPRTYDFASVPDIFGSDSTDIGAFELGNADLGLDVISNNVVVSWPAYYGDFSLQSATNLEDSNGWRSVSNLPVLIGNQFVITNRVTDAVEFFRLINQ